MMKILIVILFLLTAKASFSQNNNADLNGKTFKGTATEITSPGIDRMPIVYNDIIRFNNGRIYSDVLNMYSSGDCNYSSEVDGRRMIALTVVSFKSSSTGIADGKKIDIDFSGNIIGDISLSGLLILKYPDNTEVKFNISAWVK